MNRILKYQVPVDGQAHEIELPSWAAILHAAARVPGFVDFWVQVSDEQSVTPRKFRVFATGEPIEETGELFWLHCETAVTSDGGLVWHLMEEVEF